MTASKRVIWIDVAKAILIILMIVGHVPLHSVFRNLIYSFHMPAFILFSGYMFKPNCCDDLCRSTVRLLKSFLLPYAVFGIAYMFVADGNIKTKLMTIVTGVSFTKKIFPEAVSVGAVWFVLVLFVVRLIYLLIYKLAKSEFALHSTVLALTFVGFVLGRYGYWLPWSIDVALYSMIFYHIGYCIKKYAVLEYISKRVWLYFVLASVWGYVVFAGGLELAVRSYNNSGIAILGAVSASILIYAVRLYFKGVWQNNKHCLISREKKHIIYSYSTYTFRYKNK